MFQIEHNQLDPYGVLITTYLKSEFPQFVLKGDSALLDLLTQAIVASGKIRFGPSPSPESLVAIRQVLTHYIKLNHPIPFLVPWGSEKPNGTGIDLAEMFALKTLKCLADRVKNYYIPGVVFNVRVEDASAPHLFFDRQEAARKEAALYTSGFVNLAKVMGVDNFIKVRPESGMTSEGAFNAKADEILPFMETHVQNPDNVNAAGKLAEYGWRVPLNPETKSFYLGLYDKLYPNLGFEERQHLLARYFAGALARIALKITGAPEEWRAGGFLELSFAHPTPGIGPDRALRRIYYRTMPESITTNHGAPWRMKGFLKINGDTAKASLASFKSTEFEYNPNSVTLCAGDLRQEVQADYVIV